MSGSSRVEVGADAVAAGRCHEDRTLQGGKADPGTSNGSWRRCRQEVRWSILLRREMAAILLPVIPREFTSPTQLPQEIIGVSLDKSESRRFLDGGVIAPSPVFKLNPASHFLGFTSGMRVGSGGATVHSQSLSRAPLQHQQPSQTVVENRRGEEVWKESLPVRIRITCSGPYRHESGGAQKMNVGRVRHNYVRQGGYS